MNKTLIALALGLAAGAAALPAAAQVNGRQDNQQGRIAQGVRSGELTAGEARHLEGQQASIARQEQHMRARNGGRLNPRQRARLAERQDRANARIYRLKHNNRRY